MSHHLVNLAWKEDLPHTRKIVLLALAHHAVQSTGECFPSVRVLAAECGLSQSAVRSHIAKLENVGLVERPPTLPGGATIYRVLLRGTE